MVSTTLSLHFKKHDQLKSKVVYILVQSILPLYLGKTGNPCGSKKKKNLYGLYLCSQPFSVFYKQVEYWSNKQLKKKIKSLVSISWQYCFPSASSSYISYLSQASVRFVQFNTRQQSVSQHFYQNLPSLPKFQT